MARIRSFPPISDRRARVLVLGSMPGRESLARNQYYAHPQNAFWRIAGQLAGFDPFAAYQTRKKALKSARIALWDVLESCERAGSLDANIQHETANDFAAFFRAHPRITHVFFNGAKAQASFTRHVPDRCCPRPLQLRRLPSTSPAHAGTPFERKLAAWRVVVIAAKSN